MALSTRWPSSSQWSSMHRRSLWKLPEPWTHRTRPPLLGKRRERVSHSSHSHPPQGEKDKEPRLTERPAPKSPLAGRRDPPAEGHLRRVGPHDIPLRPERSAPANTPNYPTPDSENRTGSWKLGVGNWELRVSQLRSVAGRRRDAVEPQVDGELAVDVLAVRHREVDHAQAARGGAQERQRRDALGQLLIVELLEHRRAVVIDLSQRRDDLGFRSSPWG